MSLHISKHETDGIAILVLSGKIVLGDGSAALQDAVDALPEITSQLILDLAQVPYIDSSGLGILVAAHSRVSKRGGAIRLLHVSKRHIELLVLTKLTTIFELFDDEREAVDSFFPDRRRTQFDILEFVKRREDGKAMS